MALVAATDNAAQAYRPDPDAHKYYRSTSNCPCSGGTLSDPFDGTYFAEDKGGGAAKIELIKSGWFVAKVEFHPKVEKLWVDDTRNDGDTIHVEVAYRAGGRYHHRFASPPATSSVVDKRVINMDIPEGRSVSIDVYDDAFRTDEITGTSGRA
jgi:hypothetical protein